MKNIRQSLLDVKFRPYDDGMSVRRVANLNGNTRERGADVSRMKMRIREMNGRGRNSVTKREREREREVGRFGGR